MKKSKYRLQASSIAELLVVMIVSGIVFIALFDAVAILQRLEGGLTRQLDEGNRQLAGYRNMEELFRRSDSVLQRGGALFFYRDGEGFAEMECRDSLLVVSTPGGCDTLLDGVACCQPQGRSPDGGRVDSLRVEVGINGQKVVFFLGISQKYRKYGNE